MLRQPIVSIMGHVDHGKTSVLDTIRGSAVAAREAGGITQAIGASIIPLSTIQALCGALLAKVKLNIQVPGLLFIDTPGHAAFVNLRKRGGNLSDIAILVIDIVQGLQPQTIESIAILKQYKTPFLVALNKVDLVGQGFGEKKPLLDAIAKASPQVQQDLEVKLYQIVAQLNEQGLNADRFDRVSDYTKQLALVPVSAKSGIGIAELLMVLVGLTQRYLEKKLTIDPAAPGRGTVLEVKEVQGLGTTMDVILYEGGLRAGDTLVIGNLGAPITSRVKSLLEPPPLKEMREKKVKFVQMKSVTAATGVKIAGPDLSTVVAGMPIIGIPTGKDPAPYIAQLAAEVAEVTVHTETQGVIIKADSLGSLEALSFLLKEQQIPVMKVSVGPVTKKDIHDAEACALADPLLSAILCFNAPPLDLPVPPTVKVVSGDIIYRIIEEYAAWREERKKAIEKSHLGALGQPARIQVLKGYVFRQSNPAIAGVEILSGTLTTGISLMNKQGTIVAQVKGLQADQENVSSAEKGKRVACAMNDVIIGRQIQEGDILWTVLSEDEFRKYKELKEHLKPDQKESLKEIAEIMRNKNPVWGI